MKLARSRTVGHPISPGHGAPGEARGAPRRARRGRRPPCAAPPPLEGSEAPAVMPNEAPAAGNGGPPGAGRGAAGGARRGSAPCGAGGTPATGRCASSAPASPACARPPPATSWWSRSRRRQGGPRRQLRRLRRFLIGRADPQRARGARAPHQGPGPGRLRLGQHLLVGLRHRGDHARPGPGRGPAPWP